MSKIPIEKIIFDKDAFDRVINRQFTQLPPANNTGIQETASPTFTIDDFLALFNSLYDFIPDDVLRAMLERIAATLNVQIDDTDIQALLEEITSLRQQLIEIQLNVSKIPTEEF
jgi:predicted component of type VI protein secretion system